VAAGQRLAHVADDGPADRRAAAEGAYAVRARAVDGAGRRTTSPAITFVKGYEGRMTMTELGPAPGVTAPASARAIADDGTAFGTVGGITTVPTRWVGGSAQAMRLPAGTTEAIVWGAAGDGSVAGSARDASSRTVAVRWSPDGTPQVLPHLPGRTSSRAVAVSAAGAVGDSGGRPVWWRPDGTAVELPGLVPGQTGVAEDLDDAGTVVGHVLDADGQQHAVVWTDQGRQVTDLGTLGGVGAAALGINDVGQVVGWARDELRRTRAFVADVYDGEAMADAGVSAEYSTAHDIGDDGTILGEYADDAGHEADRNAFLVTDGRFRSLNLAIDPEAGWVPSRAYAVNGLGQVVGFGLRNGLSRGFLASGTHAPVAGDVVAETDEGTPVRLRLPASDPDPGAELALQVVGGPSHGTLSAVEGGEVVYTPQPGFTGTDAFSFLASDGALRSNLARASITVRRGPGGNQHPVAVVTAPATAAEGTTVVLDGSSSSDADGEIASFAWDLDGDGAFDDATGPTAQLALPDEGVRPVALQVTDDRGATGTGSSSVEGTNVVPLVSLPTTARVEAGTALRLDGRFSDPGADTWRATVDTGGGPVELPLSGAAFTVDVTWTEPGSRTVVVQVCDGTACGTATTTVEVTRNAAPTAVLDAPRRRSRAAPCTSTDPGRATPTAPSRRTRGTSTATASTTTPPAPRRAARAAGRPGSRSGSRSPTTAGPPGRRAPRSWSGTRPRCSTSRRPRARSRVGRGACPAASPTPGPTRGRPRSTPAAASSP
jgi:probable HAF family extracellular repeat protein